MSTATTSHQTTNESVPLTRSHITLLVCSALLTLAAGLGLPSLVVAVLAWRKNADDHPAAKRLTRIGWYVFSAFVVIGVLIALQLWSMTPSFAEFWSWDAAAEVLPVLLKTFVKTTLLITVVGTAIAATLGLALAVATESVPRFVSVPLRWLMDVIRMTPLIVQLVFVYYLVPVEWPLLWVGTAVIGVHYAMYMAESYIAGIASVDPGQWEAAKALSFSTRRTWGAVVLPQALRATLPSLGNWAISMFKDTPYLFAIGVVEVVTAAQQYGAGTFRYNEAFTLAGLIFLIASLITAVAVRKLEKSLVY